MAEIEDRAEPELLEPIAIFGFDGWSSFFTHFLNIT